MKKAIIGLVLLCMLVLGLTCAYAAGVEDNIKKIDLSKTGEMAAAKALGDKVPTSIDAVEKKMSIMPLHIRNKFLMWTRDGEHIMWGRFSNGYFTGTDNLGKKAWGIYQKGAFAGFYDGQLFYGKTSRNNWKAENLFGLKQSSGRFVVFPELIITSAESTASEN